MKKNKTKVKKLIKQVIIMNKTNSSKEVLLLAAGEIAVSVVTVLGAFLVSLFTDFIFDFTVITGAILGSAVTVINFLFLSLSVNRAVDVYLEARGTREMTEEEAEKFTTENSMLIQNKIKTSFIIRTLSMVAALILAFVTGWFNPLSTAIPMLMFRPLLYVGEFIKGKAKK